MIRVILPVWLAILFALSLAPEPVKYELGTKGGFHYAGHLIAFMVTALLFCWKPGSARRRLLCAFAACFLALALEGLEAIVYGNRFEWPDVWIDFLGIVLGFAIAGLVRKKIELTA